MSAIFVPDDARLLAPPTPDDREAYCRYEAMADSRISLTTYVIRRRLASGADPATVFTGGGR